MSVYDNNPVLPPLLPPRSRVTAEEFNPVVTAVADLRAALMGAKPS